MPWATVDDVRPLLAADLGVEAADLAAAWDGRLELAVPQARREIETALRERTFSAAQVAGCDWLLDEHKELALVAALLKGGSLTDYDLGAVERRWERIVARLKTQAVYVGGAVVYPNTTDAAGNGVAVAGGQLCGASVPRRDWSKEF